MKFKKKPIEIEAIQWTGANWTEIQEWIFQNGIELGEIELYSLKHEELQIDTLEGKMRASKGDWIIRGVKHEVYPCKPDIFELTYEPVEQANNCDGCQRGLPIMEGDHFKDGRIVMGCTKGLY